MSVASTSMTTRSSHWDLTPSEVRPAKVASAVNAPTVRTSPCENLMTSSTPKKSVKPTATSAYIMPSISPFMTYWASRPASIAQAPAPNLGRVERGTSGSVPSRAHTLLLPRQLALARGVFAIVPLDELAVLDHVLGDNRHGVLAVIIEGNLADDRVAVLHVGHLG